MTCRRVEELIPLYVGGDLRGQQASDVRAHAQTCGACRALMAEYEASQSWLRAGGSPEFDEAFVDTVRASVMSRLSADETRRPFVERLRDWLAPRRLALTTAALAALFVALALFIYLNRSRVDSGDDLSARETPAPSVEKRQDDPNRPAVDAPERLLPKRRTTHRAANASANPSRRVARRVKTTPDNALAAHRPETLPAVPLDGINAVTPSEEKLRIEIQTADPNIRIIWFAPKPAEADAP